MADIDYLEEERQKLWARLTAQEKIIEKLQKGLDIANNKILKNEVTINNRISDDEKYAKQASKETSMYRNRAKEKSDEVEKLSIDLINKYNELQNLVNENLENKKSINSQQRNIEQKQQHVVQLQKNINATYEQIKPLIDNISESTNILSEITSLRNGISTKHSEILEIQKKIENLYELATKQKLDVTKIKNQIAGYNQKNPETGEEEFVDGLKQELEQSFSDLQEDFSNEQTNIQSFQEEKSTEVKMFLNDMKTKYDDLINQIESLLPQAMTAGLSSAYQAKRKAEEETYKSAYSTFKKSLQWMFAVAIVPVCLGIYMFFKLQYDLQTIINDTPKIMTAVLALYAPIFWLAYSANKRMNLSKRLIEEYTYKESLSKTFEGLSKQIENIENEDVANDLKSKLLYIVVSMNSENPGKLIKGYNKPDHPIMDIINNSVRLTDSIQNLAQTPILGKICTPILDAINEQKQIQSEKISTGFKANQVIKNKTAIIHKTEDES